MNTDCSRNTFAEIRQKPLLTPAQELALGERKNAGAKARQRVTSGSFLTREEGLALAETMRAGNRHTPRWWKAMSATS